MLWSIPESDTYFKNQLQLTPDGFELSHLEFALKHVKQFNVAIDGGAHIGTWSIAMAKRFKSVLAFEPASDTYRCLLKNLEQFDPGHVVQPHRMALGEEAGVCIAIDDPARVGNSGARTVMPCSHRRPGKASMVSIDMLPLYSLDFLKLDIEGHELPALRGATNTIKRLWPTIMIECKRFKPSRNGGPERAVKYLNELGYVGVGGVRNDQVFVRK